LKPWFIAIFCCGDDTLYAGIPTDVGGRIVAHNAGKAPSSRYTGGRRLVELAFTEEVASRALALRREAAIKRLDRNSKLALCDSWQAEPAGQE
jgi:putative endonuclease